ncbi:hypothetical protein LINGRAHAP2_LOCUS1945, partial [Linum grandiflorum]
MGLTPWTICMGHWIQFLQVASLHQFRVSLHHRWLAVPTLTGPLWPRDRSW